MDLHTIPMFHANGWGRPQCSTMHGIKQVMVRRFEPSFVFRMIQEHGATDMCLVPTMANALIHAPDLGSVESIESAARDDRRRGIIAGIGGAGRESVSKLRMHCGLWSHRDLAGADRIAIEGAQIFLGKRAAAAPGHGGMVHARRYGASSGSRNARCAARYADDRRSGRDGRSHHGRLLQRSGGDRRSADRFFLGARRSGFTPATWPYGTRRATSTS